MDLHPGESIVFEGHPSWRALLSFYIGGIAGALVIAVVVGLVASVVLAILVGAALIAAVILFGLVKRTATDYMVSTQRLYIRRGILSKKVQQTRIDRVQNVNTDQSFRERLLRVGTVDFDTAGNDDSDFRFVGIDNPRGSSPPSTARSATRRSSRLRLHGCKPPARDRLDHQRVVAHGLLGVARGEGTRSRARSGRLSRDRHRSPPDRRSAHAPARAPSRTAPRSR